MFSAKPMPTNPPVATVSPSRISATASRALTTLPCSKVCSASSSCRWSVAAMAISLPQNSRRSRYCWRDHPATAHARHAASCVAPRSGRTRREVRPLLERVPQRSVHDAPARVSIRRVEPYLRGAVLVGNRRRGVEGIAQAQRKREILESRIAALQVPDGIGADVPRAAIALGIATDEVNFAVAVLKSIRKRRAPGTVGPVEGRIVAPAGNGTGGAPSPNPPGVAPGV